jgi:hypothetical protein
VLASVGGQDPIPAPLVARPEPKDEPLAPGRRHP